MNALNQGLQLSEAGLNLLKASEGFRAAVYPDLAGHLTIGYGHKVLVHETFPDSIDEAKALAILKSDAAIAASIVKRLVNVPLKQGQFDCLGDLTFNEGGERLAESTLLSLLNAGMYGSVPAQLYRKDDEGNEHGWIFAGGVIEPGLITRRKAEIALWNS